jgi:hypothetical protein
MNMLINSIFVRYNDRFGLNLEKHFSMLFLNNVMKLKIKKTREKILKDSQKLKYASLVGGNAFVMAMFYSLILL